MIYCFVGKIVFTIGYAGVKLPQFIEVLKEHGVTLLIDVRSVPRSQYFSDFNDVRLHGHLAKHGIMYENHKTEFGARQTNAEWFTGEVLDFEKFAESEQFRRGVEKVKTLIQNGEVVCLMCAEIDPIGCHRGILCGRALKNAGIDVRHIIAKRNGEVFVENHIALESRLATTDDLQLAYKKQNQKIGYK